MADGIRRPWISVINEGHAMPHKNFRFDGYAFADKRVTGYLAALANLCAFLHFNEWPDLCFMADLATIKIDEGVNTNVAPKLYIWRDAPMRGWCCTHPANAST